MDTRDSQFGMDSSGLATARIFTLAEANAALPLVRRIVRDIVDQYHEIMSLQAELQDRANGEIDIDCDFDIEALEEARLNAVMRLGDLSAELSAIGCELKDWESGLVDFPALRNEEPVYLCWQLGEERLGYWHDPHAGYAGRTPITPADRL